MRSAFGGALAVAMALAIPLQGLEAQQANPAHTHVGHIVDGFGGAPDGQGLLPAAEAEAAIAAQHARLATSDDTNLEWMKTHARHVLHAVDPDRIDAGPGLGLGVRQAAEGIVQHIGLAANTDGASDNLRTHAGHVSEAATAVSERATRVAELAERVERASDYTSAADLVRQMRALSEQLVAGVDLDGSGSISWGGGEGGLEQVRQHMSLLARGEGLD